ncbi:hypothetical protein CYMTET_27511 [Cymbomonas tetramitiformis]|uniref:Uncharacterized protein n=1 Tax=Cymbomonas tetramitiformis TaxID=36881 RepID=A0AAE0KWV0_9CHLO|nr:hypothetical protein CYMTET_27511 [Cymbomonas tetramitiformis]
MICFSPNGSALAQNSRSFDTYFSHSKSGLSKRQLASCTSQTYHPPRKQLFKRSSIDLRYPITYFRYPTMNAYMQPTFVPRAAAAEATPSDQEFHAEIEEALTDLQPQFAEVPLFPPPLASTDPAYSVPTFKTAKINPYHFGGSSGYGRGDPGREALEQVYAEVMGGEDACVRTYFQSGTHTIACALYGLLRPGEELLALAGPPYDTLEEVIGQRGTGSAADGERGSALSDFGIGYRHVELCDDDTLDLEAIATALAPNTRVAIIQRSCGYTVRKAISLSDIEAAVKVVKEHAPQCIVMVDNCYGEFIEDMEPTSVGADLIVGSLIKNPGGTIAPCGGYVVGKAKYVSLAAERLSSPGVGQYAGATPGEWTRLMLQGFFLAPQMVAEARKGGMLVAEVMERRGYPTRPTVGDGVTAVVLGSEQRLLAFCKAIQGNRFAARPAQLHCIRLHAYTFPLKPVNSYVLPIGGATPGYESEVVFADGTFVEGSTAELSADGPLREPYAAFCQLSAYVNDCILWLPHALSSAHTSMIILWLPPRIARTSMVHLVAAAAPARQ